MLRIEQSARDVPRSFPLDTIESAVDYDYVLIGGQKFLLPVHSENLMCDRGTSNCSRNVIDFRNYRKFGADSEITFDADPPVQRLISRFAVVFLAAVSFGSGLRAQHLGVYHWEGTVDSLCRSPNLNWLVSPSRHLSHLSSAASNDYVRIAEKSIPRRFGTAGKARDARAYCGAASLPSSVRRQPPENGLAYRLSRVRLRPRASSRIPDLTRPVLNAQIHDEEVQMLGTGGVALSRIWIA